MSEWQFKFPQTRSCLWDETAVGESTELFITRNSWIRVQFSVPALQLAVRHARQSSRKPLNCFLIATAWITEGEGIVLEVDRFDPGRLLKGNDGIVPTALIPGDVVIPCQVVVASHPLAKHLTHNLVTLKETFEQLEQHLCCHPCPLDPALLLFLRVHCSSMKDGSTSIQCGCVSPAIVCEATPIKPVPIVKTALARNLSGPLPISALQGRVKHGYVTMDSTRKVVLLLHSDPKATQLPLVGVWVSGVGSVYHPQVWTACVSYISSPSLSDRVWGQDGSFLLLVYLEGTTQPSYWQCTTRTGREGVMGPRHVPFEISCGEVSIQPSSDAGSVSAQLFPAQESSALKTLLEAVLKSSTVDSEAGGRDSVAVNLNEMSCDLPTPSPKPIPVPSLVPQRPARDSELSMMSSLSLMDDSSPPKVSQHGSAAYSTSSSSLPHSPGDSISVLSTPRLPVSTQLPQQREPPPLSSFNRSDKNEQLYVDKENISPTPTRSHHKNGPSASASSTVMEHSRYVGSSTTTRSGHQSSAGNGGSLVVFPEKQVTSLKKSPPSPTSSSFSSGFGGAASPSTQELLRQQEHQLRVLQEQVNSLLRSQSATNSPVTQVSGVPPATPPMAEAGTNTGQSLFWRPPSPLSPPLAEDSSASATPGSQYNGTSVCSTEMADWSVQTATSILSQGISEMNLDLQSYAHSPTSSHSQSFGDSASMAGRELDAKSHESSPASLLFRDQRQFYQNMLAQVNDLIQSQQNGQTSDEETDRQNSSEGTTPKCSPSPSLLQHSQTTKNSSQEERVQTAGQSDVMMEGSNHANQSRQSRSCDGGDNDVSNSFKSSGRSLSAVNSYGSGGECNHNSHQSELKDHNQPLSAGLKNSYPPLLLTLGDQSLPPLHPDVLQQQFTAGDISMLPVPRIMYVGHGTAADDGLYRATGGTTFVSQYGGADYTMDENTQMADMIALKYLGKKSGPLSESNEVPAGRVSMVGLSLSAGGGNNDRTLANMSMATRQYLQKHNLMKAPYNRVAAHKEEEEGREREGEGGEGRLDTRLKVEGERSRGGKPTDSERILDVQRLKTLPKLI